MRRVQTMNSVILCGNLTKDPELTSTNSGISVARFTLAVQRSFTNQDGEREADFINVVVWRGQAENCHKYLKKGSKAIVEGELRTRSYDDEKGNKRHVTEVIGNRVEFVGTRASDNNGDNNPPPQPELEPIDDDSLPF